MSAPSRIGRYRVTGELGRGAMGVVYRGCDDALEREVALKVMTQGLADPTARARFQREARAAARLQHPNIVVVYELGEHEGVPYMALELLEGVDLQRAIEAGIRPDPRSTLPIVLQLLAGLGHAHEHGIVHRDVKPSNLFLPAGRPAKIMDFGVARLAGLGTTTTGALSGTPSYMSPEQVQGGEVDGRSDLFSVGLILYELVTGEKAVRAQSVVEAMYKIVHEEPDLSLIRSDPEWRRLRAVLSRSLARTVEGRYPDAGAMSSDLRQALLDLGGATDWGAPADEALLLRRGMGRDVLPRSQPAPRVAPPTSGRAGARLQILRWRPRSPFLLAALALLALGLGGTLGLALRARSGSAKTSVPPRDVSAGPASARSPIATTAPSVPATPPPGATLRAQTSATVEHSAAPQAPPPAKPSPLSATTPESPDLPPAGSHAAPSQADATLDARLARVREDVAGGRWPEALAGARQVLEVSPTNSEAAALAQQAEAELVIEDCLHKARAALREGDRERALEEVRRGFLIRRNDRRLLELHREAVQ